MSGIENTNEIECCPECGAALDTGARIDAAEGAMEFIDMAKNARELSGERDHVAAASFCSCAIELATEAARPDLRARAYWLRGNSYMFMGEREIALLDYEDAHKIAPGNRDYLESLADLRAELDHERRLEAKSKGEK